MDPADVTLCRSETTKGKCQLWDKCHELMRDYKSHNCDKAKGPSSTCPPGSYHVWLISEDCALSISMSFMNQVRPPYVFYRRELLMGGVTDLAALRQAGRT